MNETTLGAIESAATRSAAAARRCTDLADKYGLQPDVEREDDGFIRVTWFDRHLNGNVSVSVHTYWGEGDEPETVIATGGDWSDELRDVTGLIEALQDADEIFQQVR